MEDQIFLSKQIQMKFETLIAIISTHERHCHKKQDVLNWDCIVQFFMLHPHCCRYEV